MNRFIESTVYIEQRKGASVNRFQAKESTCKPAAARRDHQKEQEETFRLTLTLSSSAFFP